MPSDTSRLIDKIRDAGLAPDAWPEALKSLTDALGVTGAACIIFNRRTGNVDWVCFSGLSAEFQSAYINHYAPLDPFGGPRDLGRVIEQHALCQRAPVIREIQWAGVRSLHQIADALNARGISTPRGGKWYAKSVSNLLARSA